MAKFWYDSKGRTQGLYPEWIGNPPLGYEVQVQGQHVLIVDSRASEGNNRGVQLVASASDVEATIKFRNLRPASASYQLGGVGVAFRVQDADNFVEVTTGSGASWQLGNLRERLVGNSDDSQVPALFSGDQYGWKWMRVKANGKLVQIRGWSDGDTEPSTWQLEHMLVGTTVPGAAHFILPYAHGGAVQVAHLALGTAGDTPPTNQTGVITGSVRDFKGAPAVRTVLAVRRDTGVVAASTVSAVGTGAYSFNLDPGIEYTLVLLDSDGGLLENDYAERVQL